MKRHVVLAKELQIFDVVRLPPPLLPVAVLRISVSPFLRRRDVFDRSVKLDVEDLAFKAFFRHWDAPSKVARDAALLDTLIEPLARYRRHQMRPTLARSEPRLKSRRPMPADAETDAWSDALPVSCCRRPPTAAGSSRSAPVAASSSRIGRRGRGRTRSADRCRRCSGPVETPVV